MQTVKPTVLILLISVLAFTATGVAHAQEGDPKRGIHERLFVVPRPGEVTIDGHLDDWDLSGQILSYISEQTREEKAGRMAMMYDDEAIYIGAEVRDPSPLMNRHDPEANPDKVWNADSVQVRLVIDRDEPYPANYTKFRNGPFGDNALQHLLLWYYTDGEAPGLQLRKDMDYKVPAKWAPDGLVSTDAFDAAYRKIGEDRYVFEYRIPWTTLDATNPPRAGDVVAGTIQYNFSRPDGLKISSSGGWARDVIGGGGFPFQTSGCWGKFIFAERGNVPEITLAALTETEAPKPLTFAYDLPEAGDVTVSLWDQDNVLVRNIVCQAPREAGRQTEQWDGVDFKGDPIPPGRYTWKGIYHEPITTEFLLSVHNSGTPPYKTSDGTGGWGGDHTDPITAEAFGPDMILAWPFGEAGWGLIRVDLDGDKKASSQRGNAMFLATDYENYRVFAANPHRYPGVRVFDGRDFRPINMAEDRGKPEAPAGIDKNDHVSGLVHRDGMLYVAYATRNLIAVNDGRTGELIETWDVPSPGRLDVAAGGAILAISGETVVKIRDGRSEVLIAEHLDAPTGIAVDDAGRIFVTNRGEAHNVSMFAAEGEFIGTIGKRGGRPRVGRFDPAGMLEPAGCEIDAKGRLWVAEHLDAPKRVSVWNTASGENVNQFFGGSAYSTWVMMDPQRPDEAFCHNVIWKIDLDSGDWAPYSTPWRSTGPDVPPGPPTGSSHGSGLGLVTAANGEQYGWGHKRILYLRDGPHLKPILQFMQDKVWIDANDNQRREAGEYHPAAGFGRRGGQFEWVDADLNLYSSALGKMWKARRIGDDGIPVYDFENPVDLPFGSYNPQGPAMYVDPHDGTLYQNSATRKRDEVGFGRWTRDGRRLWGIRGTLFWKRTLTMPRPGIGDLYALTAPLGVAGEFTGAGTYYSGYHLLTRDGQYVAMIMNPPASEGLGPDRVLVELFTGRLIKLPDSGRYLLLTGDQDGRIMEVHGLDTVRQLDGGSWRMTAERREKVEEALRQAKEAVKQTLVIHRWKKQLADATPVERQLRGGLGFKAAAAWDADNLYLRYDVTSPNPLTNAVSDPQSLFTGGNCIDLQLATHPDAPADRDEPAAGDVRLIVTRQKGEPVAVLFEPRVAGFDGEPILMESPVDRETFDRIREVDNVRIDLEPREGGFVAVVAVPLDVLGWKPAAGAPVKMDLGYVFGDQTGRNALKRAYWSNNSFEANVVDDLPDESRLNPEYWGDAVVE